MNATGPHSSPDCSAFDLAPFHLAPRNSPGYGLSAHEETEGSRAKANPKRVLVIDDEAPIADSLAEILIAHGYDAVAFYSGRAAIEFARERCPDLVVSDVVMPKMNGVDTVLAIRELCPVARILLFSGQAGTKDILAKARTHGHEFELVSKPIHPDQLLKKLGFVR